MAGGQLQHYRPMAKQGALAAAAYMAGQQAVQLASREAPRLVSKAMAYATRNSNRGYKYPPTNANAARTRVFRTNRQRYVAKGGPGRSGGFFGRGKSMKKIRRGRVQKIANGGVELTTEFGGTYSDANCQYLGHITHPAQLVLRMAWASVLKELLYQAGWTLAGWDEPMNLIEGTTIVVTYKTGSNYSTAQATPFSATGAFISFTTLVSYFLDPDGNFPGTTTCPWADASNMSRDWQFTRIQFLVAPTTIDTIFHSAFLDLNECMIKSYTKSTLKMQNRSVTAVLDNEADDVNNVPIHGKSYSGAGTGAFYSLQNTTISYHGQYQTGVIDATSSSYNGTQEPPQPFHFNKIKSSGKVKLEPGELKTSSLAYGRSFNFSRLFNIINPWSTAYSKPVRPIGKYRFFAWEKILDCQSSVPVAVSFEHNLSMNYKALCRRRRYTTEKTEVNNYI